jgi:membrane fusion protein (multidrug efflux system)
VQQGPKGHFVWVVTGEGTVEARPVVVGDWYKDDWFISEGLRAGERIVVDGVLLLRPGIKVTVQPDGTPPGRKPADGKPPAEGGKDNAVKNRG